MNPKFWLRKKKVERSRRIVMTKTSSCRKCGRGVTLSPESERAVAHARASGVDPGVYHNKCIYGKGGDSMRIIKMVLALHYWMVDKLSFIAEDRRKW